MKGEEMKAFRETRGLSQAEFAEWLNRTLDRRYDKQKVSRWETGAERIPLPVDSAVAREALGLAAGGGPPLILAVANQKGGVAKTVSAVNLASLLAQSGHPTLLIDLDPQANATMHLGIDTYALEAEGRTLYYAFRGNTGLHEIVCPIDTTGLRVAPSSIRLAESEVELAKEPGGELALKEMLADLAGFDFVVLDTPPNIGELTKNALAAAHLVLVPCQTEQFSVLGIRFLLDNVAKIRRRMNPGLSLLGILPTLYKERERNDRLMLSELTEHYRGKVTVYPPIPKSATYAQSTTIGRAAADAAPTVPGIAVYKAIAADLVEERRRRLPDLVRTYKARREMTDVA